MQRDVELTGGPLAGCRWPARLEADRTLWIGIGADGGEYDGRSRLKAIAIYERAGGDEAPRFDFARLEGPGARIAELGRRITRLRANWTVQRRSALHESEPVAEAAVNRAREPALMQRADAARIAARVLERWRHAVEAQCAPGSIDSDTVRIDLTVPGEADELADLLRRNGIAADLLRTTTEVRSADRAEVTTLETGAVEVRTVDVEQVAGLLRAMTVRD